MFMCVRVQILEARLPGTNTTIKQHTHEEPGTAATVEREDGKVQSGAEATEQALQKANEMTDKAQVSYICMWMSETHMLTENVPEE